jgi:hypothetical protein
MSVQTITQIIENIERVPVPADEVERVSFTYQNREYTLDLNPANALKYHESFRWWVERADAVQKSKPKTKRPAKAPAAPKAPAAETETVAPAAEIEVAPAPMVETEVAPAAAEPATLKRPATKRPATKRATSKRPTPKKSAAKGPKRPHIRQWAKENGFPLPDRGGRVGRAIEEAYDAAHA